MVETIEKAQILFSGFTHFITANNLQSLLLFFEWHWLSLFSINIELSNNDKEYASPDNKISFDSIFDFNL